MSRARFAAKAVRKQIVIGFRRTRVFRHQTIDDVRVALVPFRSGSPDVILARNVVLSEEKQRELNALYCLVSGVPLTYTDSDTGQVFFQIPDAVIAE